MRRFSILKFALFLLRNAVGAKKIKEKIIFSLFLFKKGTFFKDPQLGQAACAQIKFELRNTLLELKKPNIYFATDKIHMK